MFRISISYMQFSNKTDDQKIWDGLVRFNKTDRGVLAPHFPEHRKKVETGNYVFFSERSVLRMWSEDTCDLVFLEQIFYKANFAIGFPLNSPYTRRFSQAYVSCCLLLFVCFRTIIKVHHLQVFICHGSEM